MNLPAISSSMPLYAEWEDRLANYNSNTSSDSELVPLEMLDKLAISVAAAKKPAEKDFVTKWAKFLTGAYPARS